MPKSVSFEIYARNGWTTVATRFGADAFSNAAAIRFMELSPAAAETRARQVLGTNPDEPQALRLLAAPLRRARRDEEARSILERLVRTQPQMEFAWRALGLVLRCNHLNRRV
jgi:predicted Zn-dependent protease